MTKATNKATSALFTAEEAKAAATKFDTEELTKDLKDSEGKCYPKDKTTYTSDKKMTFTYMCHTAENLKTVTTQRKWRGKVCADQTDATEKAECLTVNPPPEPEQTAEQKAAALKTKWTGKTCSDQTDAALKKECETAQAGAKAIGATFMTVFAMAALM